MSIYQHLLAFCMILVAGAVIVVAIASAITNQPATFVWCAVTLCSESILSSQIFGFPFDLRSEP